MDLTCFPGHSGNKLCVTNNGKEPIVIGKFKSSLYALSKQSDMKSLAPADFASSHTRHERLSHIRKRVIVQMFRNGVLLGIPQLYKNWKSKSFACELCKAHRARVPNFRAIECASLVLYPFHTAVCGPMEVFLWNEFYVYLNHWESF